MAIDGEMFWNAGSHVYDPSWPITIDAVTAAWRLREMHYTTLSLVHGYSQLDGKKVRGGGGGFRVRVWV